MSVNRFRLLLLMWIAIAVTVVSGIPSSAEACDLFIVEAGPGSEKDSIQLIYGVDCIGGSNQSYYFKVYRQCGTGGWELIKEGYEPCDELCYCIDFPCTDCPTERVINYKVWVRCTNDEGSWTDEDTDDVQSPCDPE